MNDDENTVVEEAEEPAGEAPQPVTVEAYLQVKGFHGTYKYSGQPRHATLGIEGSIHVAVADLPALVEGLNDWADVTITPRQQRGACR
mgnify:CR=1 FL=1